MFKLHAKYKFRISRQFPRSDIIQLLQCDFPRRPGRMRSGFHFHFQPFRQCSRLDFKGKSNLTVPGYLFRSFNRGMDPHARNRNIFRVAWIGRRAASNRNFNRITDFITGVSIFSVKKFKIRIFFNFLIINRPSAFSASVFAGHMGKQTPVRRLFH